MIIHICIQKYICLGKSEYHNRFSRLPYVVNFFSLFSYLLESMEFS